MRKPPLPLAVGTPSSLLFVDEETYPLYKDPDAPGYPPRSIPVPARRSFQPRLPSIPEHAVRFAPNDQLTSYQEAPLLSILERNNSQDHHDNNKENTTITESAVLLLDSSLIWYSPEELAALKVETGLRLRQYLQKQTAAAMVALNSNNNGSNRVTSTGSHGRSITISCPNRSTTTTTMAGTPTPPSPPTINNSDSDWCPRGLEYVLEGRPREKIRHDHIRKVLDHYQASLQDSTHQVLTTAQVAKASSLANGSLRRARSFALCDAKVAQRIQTDPTTAKRTSSTRGKPAVVRIRGSSPVMAAGCA